jgi:predicted PurR-regulated permease PerM
VLVVAVLYCAQAVLMPLALAASSVRANRSSLVSSGRIGRVPAVLATVVLGSEPSASCGMGTRHAAREVERRSSRYRTNIRQKVADIRRAGKASTVQKVQDTIDDIKTEIAKAAEPRGEPEPVVVRPQPADEAWAVPAWLGPVVAPLTTAGLVIAMVIFMLLNREDLRDRLIRLVGRGHRAVTTRA